MSEVLQGGAFRTPLLMAVSSSVTSDPAESIHVSFLFLQQGEPLTPPPGLYLLPGGGEQLVGAWRGSWSFPGVMG